MNGPGQVTGGKLFGFTHIQDYIGVAYGALCLVQRNFADRGFGFCQQIVGSFHVNFTFKKI